jgi:hypothetical protein
MAQFRYQGFAAKRSKARRILSQREADLKSIFEKY